MTKSESIKSLAEALCKFQAGMEAITKDATNPFFKSKYASLSAIIEDTREPLSANGLSYAQFPTGIQQRGNLFNDEAIAESGPVGLTTILMHSSGEWLGATTPLILKDKTAQGLGSSITYMRRYALCAILGLQVEDDDGNEASKPSEKAVAPSKAVPVTRPKAVADAKKKEIKDLVDKRLDVPFSTGLEYYQFVEKETGLKLEPEQYDEIITRLKALK